LLPGKPGRPTVEGTLGAVESALFRYCEGRGDGPIRRDTRERGGLDEWVRERPLPHGR
jgi:hypothetical protein